MNTLSLPVVSVVIPSYNRAGMLDGCLATLEAQDYPRDRWEAIVVNDGSTDRTERVVREHGRRMPLVYAYHPERLGSGPARNTGVAEARGELVLFLDSDTLAPRWLIAEHARSHEGRRCFVDAPAINVAAAGVDAATLEARWVRLLAAMDVAGARFVTVNVSCRRQDLLDAGGFDVAFGARYGWEDTELGLRLCAIGVKRVKNRHAYVLHRQLSSYDWRARGRKQEEAGINAAYFLSKHRTPEVERLVRGRRRLARLFTACGLDGRTVAAACDRFTARGPLSWAIRQIHDIQQYERGVQTGGGPSYVGQSTEDRG